MLGVPRSASQKEIKKAYYQARPPHTAPTPPRGCSVPPGGWHRALPAACEGSVVADLVPSVANVWVFSRLAGEEIPPRHE